MRVFVGMETSGQLRRRLARYGHDVVSCDMLDAEDDWRATGLGRHIRGDVFTTLESLRKQGWEPNVGIFHPTCTYHTLSAAWAFNDPDYERYPGVGYHQRVRPNTLVGEARRLARELAEADVEAIKALPFPKLIENPRGTLPKRTSLGQPCDVLQPYEFGDDASKATCIWAFDENGEPIEVKATRHDGAYVLPRIVNGRPRWANQTDSGQNRLSPADDRWKERSRTYPGIADALVMMALTIAH